jgi:hypothetical protein
MRSSIRSILQRPIAGSGVALVLLLVTATSAGAQATRTWVSGVGDDANPCSRTAPCKTFAGAITKTAPHGEIDVLDPGGFGAVTITQSVIIDGSGTFGSVLVAGTNAIVVQAAPSDTVILRGLSLDGLGGSVTPGLNGIRFLTGQSLDVENCVIANFANFGIDAEAPGSTLTVADTSIRNAAAGGIQIAPTSGGARAFIERTRVERGAFGVHILGDVVATLVDVSAFANTGAGFWAEMAPAEMNVDPSTSAGNGVGIRATSGGVVHMAGVTLVGNGTSALLEESGGVITPFSGSLITGNPPGGAATCEIGGLSTVGCGDASSTCPQPSCPAPVIDRMLGPCKHCKTKGGKTICVGCGINLQ